MFEEISEEITGSLKDDILLPRLMGERVIVYGVNYFYTGQLVAVDDFNLKLDDVSIVYETGSHDSDEFKNAQKLKGSRLLSRQAYESIEALDVIL